MRLNAASPYCLAVFVKRLKALADAGHIKHITPGVYGKAATSRDEFNTLASACVNAGLLSCDALHRFKNGRVIPIYNITEKGRAAADGMPDFVRGKAENTHDYLVRKLSRIAGAADAPRKMCVSTISWSTYISADKLRPMLGAIISAHAVPGVRWANERHTAIIIEPIGHYHEADD